MSTNLMDFSIKEKVVFKMVYSVPKHFKDFFFYLIMSSKTFILPTISLLVLKDMILRF